MSKQETKNLPSSRSGQDAFSRTRQKMQTISLMQHFGLDGYSNSAANIGLASPLMAGGAFIRTNLSNEELTTAYMENWMAKRIIDTPSEDMTRNWYTLSTAMSQEKLEKLHRLEARHSVKQEITNALRWARLYGGAIAIMIVDDFYGKPAAPLIKGLLSRDCFHGLLVCDRTMIEPSLERVSNLNDPDFGLPKYYTVYINDENGGNRPVRIHHSRVLRFIGREVPQAEMERNEYWGMSELNHIWDPLQRLSATAANITELVYRANLLCLKSNDITEMLSAGTDEHTENVFRLMETENHFRTSYGLQLLSENDSMENLKYDFAGLPQIFEQQMLDMTGAAEIPATRLFGRSPQGMNATGESDLHHYYEMIASLQERMLRPALERLLPVMAMSCWGHIPKDMQILFEPMETLSTGDQIKQANEHAETVIKLFESGLISREEGREELAAWSERLGVLTKMKAEKEVIVG